MEIKQQFTVAQPLEVVWDALGDIHRVVGCVPGAEIDSISDDGSEVEGRIRTKVGPISAAFAGRGKITRDDATHTGQVEGSGADRNSSSRVKLTMDYDCTPGEDGKCTTTHVIARVALSGPLAQFGKGALMNDIAAAMIAEFTANFSQTFKPASSSPATGEQEPARPAASSELRPMKLLWIVIKSRLARLFGASRG